VNRRAFLAGTLGLFVAPLAGEAQALPKGPQVGLLWFGSRSSESSSVEAFMTGLRELGYVEGQNVVLQPDSRRRIRSGSPPRPPSSSASAWMSL